MWLFYDNVVTIMVAVIACAYAWLFGGTVSSALPPVIPWLWVILLETMVCFPQRHYHETTYEARERMWKAMRRDPLMWVSLGFCLLLLVPFANKGLCPICDYPEIVSGADPKPIVPFLPFCVNRLHHLNVVMWFVPALTAMLAVKHTLLKRGKRLVLDLIVWNGFILAILGFVQQACGAQAPLWAEFPGNPVYFFSTFGYPNMAGDYFTTLFALSIGAWRWRVDDYMRDRFKPGADPAKGKTGAGSFWRRHYLLIPAILFFLAALMTLSRAAIILVTLLAIILFAHTFTSFFAVMPKAKRVKASAWCLLGLVAISLCVVFFMPSDLQKEVDTLNSTTILDRVTGKGQYHTRVATEVWKDNAIFGCGGWGYKHLCIPKMTERELLNLQKVGGINVHNDYLQFLAEHGLVGLGALVAIVVFLLMPIGPVWRALLNSVRFLEPRLQPPKPMSVFVLPAPVFCILASATATFIHGFGDCPMRSPAVMTLFFVELAAIDGFLPRIHIQKIRHHHHHHAAPAPEHHHHHHHHHHAGAGVDAAGGQVQPPAPEQIQPPTPTDDATR